MVPEVIKRLQSSLVVPVVVVQDMGDLKDWRCWKGAVFLYSKVVQNCITSLLYMIIYLVSYCDCFFFPAVFSMYIFSTWYIYIIDKSFQITHALPKNVQNKFLQHLHVSTSLLCIYRLYIVSSWLTNIPFFPSTSGVVSVFPRMLPVPLPWHKPWLKVVL